MWNRVQLVRSASLLVLLANVLIFATVDAQERPGSCPGPCDLSKVSPVCGADGITYQSSCLAVCQGVAVARKRACKPREGSNFASVNPAQRAGPTTVDLETMQRFKSEGFSFVGQAKSDPNFRPKQMKVMPSRGSASTRHNHAAMRFVASTGFLYATTAAGSRLAAVLKSTAPQATVASASAAGAFMPAYNPDAKPIVLPRGINASDASTASERGAAADAGETSVPGGTLANLGRKLLDLVSAQTVFGADDRQRVMPTIAWPWRTVGLVLFSVSGSTYGCSGTMISPTSFLTAAHCVHSGKDGEWASWLEFSPGADGARRPYGTFQMESATIYTEWAVNGCNSDYCYIDQFRYDLAVVQLYSATNAGWLGMAISDVFNQVPITTAGYPGDKPYGTMWRAQCSISDNNPLDFITNTGVCDIFQGQSGSGVWQNDNFAICAVVSHGDNESNGFMQLTTDRFWDMLSWAGGAFTIWSDPGANDGWKSIYLARHNVGEFCGAPQALRSFQLELRWSPAEMRVRYQCDVFRAIGGASIRYVTQANDAAGGSTIVFDRHNIACQDNQVLQRWRLIRPSAGTIAFEYVCAPASINTATCEALNTPWNNNGFFDNMEGAVIHLSLHSVACPAGKVLTQWQLQNDSSSPQYRIAFTCCGR